jgi:hypothetical protein
MRSHRGIKSKIQSLFFGVEPNHFSLLDVSDQCDVHANNCQINVVELDRANQMILLFRVSTNASDFIITYSDEDKKITQKRITIHSAKQLGFPESLLSTD